MTLLEKARAVTEQHSELREALAETLRSPGWLEVIRPKLAARLAAARAALEDAQPTDAARIAGLQSGILLLREIVDQPEVTFRL